MAEVCWDPVEIEIKRIVSEARRPLDPNAIANSQDLLEAGRLHAPTFPL
jgi:hypothetical protein